MSDPELFEYYHRRCAELAAPYSKPMFSEQSGELDGIESAAKWLRARAGEPHA